MKCLIVDDDAICRRAVSRVMRKVAECHDAADGNEAVAKFRESLIRQEPYDVVFLDILMPGIDGHETAKAIRSAEAQFPNIAKVKIIMVTILRSVNDAMKSFCDAQATAYLVKPVTEEKLLDAFSELGFL